MSYNEKTSERISNTLMKKGIEFEEKKMFGGISFMIKGKMSVGVMKDDLTVRVTEEKFKKALSDPSAREMDFTGRPLKGFLYVNESGFKTEKALNKWIDLGINFVDNLKIGKYKK